MKISTKGRYGVRIMIDIALHLGDAPVRLSDISARQGVTLKYTEQITGMLVKGGLLRSVRGASGGYVLAKAPDEYTAGEILRCTEGEFSPDDDFPPYQGGSCAAQKLWEGLYRRINEYLDGVTLQDLIDWSPDPADYYSI